MHRQTSWIEENKKITYCPFICPKPFICPQLFLSLQFQNVNNSFISFIEMPVQFRNNAGGDNRRNWEVACSNGYRHIIFSDSQFREIREFDLKHDEQLQERIAFLHFFKFLCTPPVPFFNKVLFFNSVFHFLFLCLFFNKFFSRNLYF